MVLLSRFGIFPSWGLSQRLQRTVGPYRAREVSLTATPVEAHTAERWGLVNRVVAPSELMRTAITIAEAILKNNEGLVVKYKTVINDGFKLPLGEALKLEQVSSPPRLVKVWKYEIKLVAKSQSHVFFLKTSSHV